MGYPRHCGGFAFSPVEPSSSTALQWIVEVTVDVIHGIAVEALLVEARFLHNALTSLLERGQIDLGLWL